MMMGTRLPAPQMGAFSQAASSSATGQSGPTPEIFQRWLASRMPQGDMASKGRFGDTQMAHMTPGEIAVPPQLQTPRVLATLNQEFQQRGVSPSQFTAGSPQASINPATGQQEFSFLSSFLPIALSLAGNAIAPGIGSALGSTLSGAALSSIGSGLGATAGGLLTGQDPMQALLSGAGSGLGGYMLGKAFSPAAAEAAKAGADSGTNALASAAQVPTPNLSSADLAFGRKAVESAFANPVQKTAMAASPPWQALSGMMPRMENLPSMIGGAAGGYLGSKLGAPQKPVEPNLPRGFHDRATPVSELPPWDVMLGQNTYNGPRPNFNGYNPLAPNAASYNFYR